MFFNNNYKLQLFKQTKTILLIYIKWRLGNHQPDFLIDF
ncbi:hypothetical protein FEM21_06010 [Flavobacterium seoulense]|uniref:Uncharacterized protein n=1 Tax=Flavobacterium seoulense TaxID=1492738 RepID=A0A066WYP8_9FLAO|nr:hypothetical protein FEM21_06010 [Flavobacterium seoulense]